MDKRFKILDLNPTDGSILVEYTLNGKSVSTSFNHAQLYHMDAPGLKKLCANNFPDYAFVEELKSIEVEEEKKELSQEVIDIKNVEFVIDDIYKEEEKHQGRENLVTTMYGTKYNVMSVKHIIIETLREMGLIK